MKMLYHASMVLLAGIFLFSVTNIILYHKDAGENESKIEKIRQEVTQETARELLAGPAPGAPEGQSAEEFHAEIDVEKLREINADAVGWIVFDGLCAGYPLVQGDNNLYYLNHAFTGEKNAAGSIFVDCRNQSFDDQNVVIYGHNMMDGTMFGSLKDVFSEDFWEKEGNDIIYITDSGKCLRNYKIFSYYTVGDETYYITTSFANHADYAAFLDVIKARSEKELHVDVTADDQILTMSTCAGAFGMGKRRVIHAKRINSGIRCPDLSGRHKQE